MLYKMLLILSSVSLNAFAQLFIRKGMLKFGDVKLGLDQLLKLVVAVFTNGYLLAGMFCYGISILLWMAVLSKVNVSFAYPFSSIGYILATVLAYFWLQEPLTPQKIAGILVICAGAVILSYSPEVRG